MARGSSCPCCLGAVSALVRCENAENAENEITQTVATAAATTTTSQQQQQHYDNNNLTTAAAAPYTHFIIEKCFEI